MHRATALAFTVACAAAQQPTAAPVPAWDLDAACAAATPPAAEALWTTIPWRTSFTDALAEAARTGKPVFLYVNDGDVRSGRC